MRHSSIRRTPALAAVVLLTSFAASPFAASAESAESAESAKGSLTVEGQNKPLSIELTHAYLVTGPDTFEKGKVTRRLVFTAKDERATIEACKEVRCATLSSADGMSIELSESSPPNMWAHIAPMQYSSGISGAITFDVDTPDRVAGSIKLDTSNVKASIVFDASLLKTFANPD